MSTTVPFAEISSTSSFVDSKLSFLALTLLLCKLLDRALRVLETVSLLLGALVLDVRLDDFPYNNSVLFHLV